MSARNLIIALSLTASAAGVAAWVFIGPAERPVAQTAPKPVKVVKSAPRPAIDRPLATAENAQPAQPQSAGVKPAESAIPAVQTPLTTEELAQRAARVEQEANHDLRRLVKLLDLDEQQQDQVFQTLAQHSPSWTPGLQFEGSAAAGMAGSRSLALAPDTGLYTVPTDQTGKSTTGELTASTDPMDEIMALLSPEQQDTLLQEEMDRTAWWAEVIQQITPPDDVPAIDGSAPVEPPVYEGSTTLE